MGRASNRAQPTGNDGSSDGVGGAGIQEPATEVEVAPTVAMVWRGPDDLRPFLVPIGDIVFDAKNTNKHPPEGLPFIQFSLDDSGQQSPCLGTRMADGKILLSCGHGVITCLRAAGCTHAACIVASTLDEAKGRLFGWMDNQSGRSSTWNAVVLGEILAEYVAKKKKDGRRLGFTEDEMCRVLRKRAEQLIAKSEPSMYVLMIECADETEQAKLLEQLVAEGYDVKAGVA